MSFIECLVLGLLSEGIRYGHEIDKALEKRKIRLWTKATRATVYQALDRVTKKGWVISKTEKIGKMPERTVYSLTDAGKDALRQMILEGLASTELFRFDYCIPVMLLSFLPRDEVIAQMQKRKEMIEKDIFLKLPPEEIDNDPNIYLGQRANLRFLRSHCQMEIQWLEWMIVQLKTGTDIGKNIFG